MRLALYYFRDIDRNDLIKAATAPLERQQANARLKPELDQLHASFRNIRSGDRYALDFRPGRGLNLEINGQVVFSSRMMRWQGPTWASGWRPRGCLMSCAANC